MANSISFAHPTFAHVGLDGMKHVFVTMTITTDSNYDSTNGIPIAASAQALKDALGMSQVDMMFQREAATESDFTGDWLRGKFDVSNLIYRIEGLPVNAANIPPAHLANAYALGSNTFTCIVEAIGR